jgi:hypothetical protein
MDHGRKQLPGRLGNVRDLGNKGRDTQGSCRYLRSRPCSYLDYPTPGREMHRVLVSGSPRLSRRSDILTQAASKAK